MKAQSGIEYLVTYGWAVVALGVATGAIYSYSAPSCAVETDVFHPDLRIDDAGLNSQNQLQMLFRSSSNDRIQIKEVRIGGQDGVTQSSSLVLEPGETQEYLVAEGGDSNGCAEMDITIVHDRGPVKNQKLSGTIRLPVNLVQAVINFLSAGGGEITTLRVNSSLKPVSGEICFGDNCNLTTISTNERVARSGDTLQGALLTDRLEFNCIGDNCTDSTGTLTGNVSETNNTMDGTLYLSDVSDIQELRIQSYQ